MIIVVFNNPILNSVFTYFSSGISPEVWGILEFVLLVVFAITSVAFARLYYIRYIQEKFIYDKEWVLMNIRIPREVLRSPEAMELVLNAFHQGGGIGTWYNRLVKGAVLMWFSLEIVSIEGNIYFFVHAPRKFKDLIESQLYAQYPQAEVTEVEDYTKYVPLFTRDNGWNIFGAEMVLTDPDPYPIKTYVDYGLDKSVGQKEEEKIDPLTLQLEFLGSIGAGEQIWTQIIVRKAHKRFSDPGVTWWNPSTWNKKRDWVGEGKDLLKKLAKDAKGEDGDNPFTQMSKGQKDVFEAVERSINKLGFDAGIRVMYVAKDEAFDPNRIAGLLGMYRPFGSTYLNGFRPVGKSIPDFDYPWQDKKGRRKDAIRKELQKSYIERAYFYPPYDRKPFVLNTEELATLFHFPGKVLVAPGIKRVESRTAEPPSNLPQ